MSKVGSFLSKLLGWKNRDRISFEDGTYIEFLNPEGIIYVEGEHRLEIVWYFEKGLSMRGRVLPLDVNFWNWDEPSIDEKISTEKEKEILRKVKFYYKKHRIPLRIVDSEKGELPS